MATFKHISSKNADYGAAEKYLTFVHDEFSMKPTLDENGRLILREDYRISTLNCGEEDFAIACMRANLRYGKNQKREDVKSHHYIISFDPRDGTDNGLTVDRAQQLGEEFCKTHFCGHQALVCTHPDGHNHSGNIHVHIVGELRKPPQERYKVLPERNLLTLEQLAAQPLSDIENTKPDFMFSELDSAMGDFMFRWSLCLSQYRVYFTAEEHRSLVCQRARDGIGYLNRIIEGDIPVGEEDDKTGL